MGDGTGDASSTGTGSGAAAGSGYYEHGSFSGNVIATSSELYDTIGSINTMSQTQTPHLYATSITNAIGLFLVPVV